MSDDTLFTLDASRIDWTVLRSQKLWLLDQNTSESTDEIAFEATEGLLSFLDYVQDSAVDQGLASEEEVFGFSSAPNDTQSLAAAGTSGETL